MAKTSRASRNAKSVAPAASVTPIQINHAESVDSGEQSLTDLIDSLNAPAISAASDEVIESAIDDSAIAAAVSGAEAIDEMVAAATPDGDAGSAAPTGSESDVKPAPVKLTKEERAAAKALADAAKKEARAAAKALKAAEKAAADAGKPAPVPRKHYSDKTERLKDRVGTDLPGYSVLTMADAGVTAEELTAVMDKTMGIIKAMNGKAQNWAVKFIEFLAGKKPALSEVTGRIFKVLNRDGHLTTGNDGNVYKDLVSKPYSPGAARAMSGNNLIMLKALQVIKEDGKGKFIANPDSLLMIKVNSMLFAAPAAPVVEGEAPTVDETTEEAVTAE